MLSLLSERKTFVDAELVGEDLLLFQIHLRLMQLTSVDVGDGVRDDMDVKMVFVLVDADQALISRKEFFAEFSSDLQTLLRGDLLVLVETDDVVCIHPPGILFPEPLFREKCLIDIIVGDLGWFIRTGDVNIQGGKIASYDNQSGHYKPNKKSMSVADEAFGKLSPSLFKKKRGK